MISTIVRFELKKIFKQKSMIFWTFILPILFIVLFASIFGNMEYSFDVHYMDQDKSPASKDFIKHISSVDGFNVLKETDKEKVLSDIKNGKTTTFITIPKGFGSDIENGNQTNLDFYFDGTKDASQSVQPVRSVISNILNGYREGKLEGVMQSQFQDQSKVNQILSPPIDLKENEITVKKINAVTQIVPGYAVMFVFFIVITMARSFSQHRESGMLARLSSTPMNRVHYVIGMWIPNVILVMIQIGVLLYFGYLVYHITLGNIFALSILAFILALAVTSLGLFISFSAKTEQLALGITQILTLGGAALGGLWFPLDLMPGIIQKIAHVIPQYWAQKGFVGIMARGYGLTDILPSLLFLGAFTIICLTLSVLTYKHFMKGAVS